MKIVLRKSESLGDWYVIERAEHDGRTWFEPTGHNTMTFMDSARISDACVEGSAAEMRQLAKAIKLRGSVSFKRCSVRVSGGAAYFHSPRNSTVEEEVPIADADAFADLVLTELVD